MKNFVALLIVAGLYFINAGLCYSQVTEIESMGRSFEIAEPDALEDIMARVREKGPELSKQLREYTRKAALAYQPKDLASLPVATTNRMRDIALNWTLDFDIKDQNGEILYPKGYRFNPAAYKFWKKRMVVFDGDNVDQVAWIKSSGLAEDPTSMFLLSGGSYVEVMKELGRHVFYLTEEVADRFQLQYVPSIVVQNGVKYRVAEFVPPEAQEQGHETE